jgi:hypothetical protein
MKMEQTECSETSAYKIQTPGNYPEENIQHQFIVKYTYIQGYMFQLHRPDMDLFFGTGLIMALWS